MISKGAFASCGGSLATTQKEFCLHCEQQYKDCFAMQAMTVFEQTNYFQLLFRHKRSVSNG